MQMKENNVGKGFIIRIIRVDRGFLIAGCDEELLGKKFTEGKKQIDLTSNFYEGEKYSDKDYNKVLNLMKNAYIINIVGRRIVDLALKNKIIDSNRVLFISGVPTAQSVNDNNLT